MRKWIVLAFVLGFIAGGSALYFYLPTRGGAPMAEKTPPPGAEDDTIPPPDAQSLSEPVEVPPDDQLNETAPRTPPSPDQSPDARDDSAVRPPRPDEMPQDKDPNDDIVDMSGSEDDSQ